MQLDSPGSLRTTARDLADEAGFPYLLSQAGKAGQGISMDVEDEHSELSEHSWSQPSYSDAESAASSVGGRSAASSSLSSRALFNRRPRPPPTHREGGSSASLVPASPDGINHEATTGRHNRKWREEEDQRLIQIVEAKGPQQWSKIAQTLNINRTGKQCRER